MLHVPAQNLTVAAQQHLERFCSTSAAKDLEDAALDWEVVEWSWEEGPTHIMLRSEQGDVLEFDEDEDGLWTMHQEPNVPHEPLEAAEEFREYEPG